MRMQLCQAALVFTLDSTEGSVRFNQYAYDSWVVFFSHPRDFTPI